MVGGKHFEKYDGNDGSVLAGAEFVIQLNNDIVNEKGTTLAIEGQYIQFTTEDQGKGAALTTYNAQTTKGVKYVDDIKGSTIFPSGSDGKFFVQGLKYADENAYLMVETESMLI